MVITRGKIKSKYVYNIKDINSNIVSYIKRLLTYKKIKIKNELILILQKNVRNYK